MSDTSRIRVLVVDDSRDTAFVTASLVQLWGYATRTCCEGTEVLEVALDYLPDIILLDLGMPRVNGFDNLKKIRQHPKLQQVFVAAVTGYGMQSDREATAVAGFDVHLLKPVSPDDLKAVLDHFQPSK